MGNYSTKRYSTIVDSGISGGASSFADVNSLPANPSLGDFAIITGTNKLYVYDGSAWFNIALANQAPTAISGNQAGYTLATDGTPTVVTLVSTDPEGFPLTWSATTSGDTQVGTVTQADNVFTITPSTDQANIGTLSIEFSVTDGSNTETSVSSFTLSFFTPHPNVNSTFLGTGITLNSNYINQGNGIYEVSDNTGTVWKIWANFGSADTYGRWDGHALIRDQLSHTASNWESFDTTSQGSFPSLPTAGNFKTDGAYLHSNAGAGFYSTTWYHDTGNTNQAWQSIKNNAYANRGSLSSNGANGGIVAAKPPAGAREIMWVWGNEHSNVANYVSRYDTVQQAVTYMEVRGSSGAATDFPPNQNNNVTILTVDDDDVIFAGELGGTVPYVMFCLYRD